MCAYIHVCVCVCVCVCARTCVCVRTRACVCVERERGLQVQSLLCQYKTNHDTLQLNSFGIYYIPMHGRIKESYWVIIAKISLGYD